MRQSDTVAGKVYEWLEFIWPQNDCGMPWPPLFIGGRIAKRWPDLSHDAAFHWDNEYFENAQTPLEVNIDGFPLKFLFDYDKERHIFYVAKEEL